MGTRQQPRKPAGTPVGGQFAPTDHDEADIDLSAQAKSKAREPKMLVLRDGTREWRLDNGKLHRDGGPAIEKANGTRLYYRNDKLDRDDGPAVEMADGTRMWFRDDKLHRDGGPAIE